MDCRALLAMTLHGLPRSARNGAAWIAALRPQWRCMDCRASLAMTLHGLPRFARNDAAWIAALRPQWRCMSCRAPPAMCVYPVIARHEAIHLDGSGLKIMSNTRHGHPNRY
jgi:hypothetical protein